MAKSKPEINFERILAAIGHKGGYRVLTALSNGFNKYNDIVRESRIERSTVYRRLEEFEEVGLITSEYDKSLKQIIYTLTPLGSEIAPKLKELHEMIELVFKRKEGREVVFR